VGTRGTAETGLRETASVIHRIFLALRKAGSKRKRASALDSALADLVFDETAVPASSYKACDSPRTQKTAFAGGCIANEDTPLTSSIYTPPQVVEEFRQLRDRLMLSNDGQEPKTIAVCKANASEGTSTVACHLAIAFAHDPRVRVILVDSDLRHPGLHRLLGVSLENGLYEILTEGASTTKEQIKKTVLPNLCVITSGVPLSHQSIIFSSKVFTEVLETLKTDFSIVIVDTPPTLADDTALAVAARCDGVILVVQAEQTRWENAQEAQARLRRAGAKFLGVVLNRRTYPIPEFLYKRL
jgi:capsular exopolysaccharide synthesis family protein